jgi:hypothetical protein
MSSHKKRAKGSGDGGNSKKVRGDEASETQDFLKDGLDNKEITDLVQDIMKIIHDNKCAISGQLSHASVVHNITEDDKFKFFIERYPMLFDMVTKETGFDYSFFEYFLSKRETIIKKKETSEEVHKQVGQEMFDLYYKKP